MGNTISKKCSAILIVGSLVFQGCIAYGNKEKVSLSAESKTHPALNSTLASVDVSNNTVSISGTNLSGVTGVKIRGNGVNTTLSISSKTDTQISAVAAEAISLLVGGTFELILSSASAQSTYPVTFTLDSMGATPGQILKFNNGSWGPDDLTSSQTYLGTWDAANQSPALKNSPDAGDYYIISAGGDYPNVGDTYDIGDWIMYSGTQWEKVASGLGSKLSITGGTMSGVLKLDSQLKIKGNSKYVTLKGSASLANDIELTLPITTGTSGQMLVTDGAGVLSWSTPLTSAAPTGNAGGDLSGTYPNPTITGLSAAKIADGSVNNTKFQYLSGVTSDIQAQLDSKQSGGSFITALTGEVTASGPGSTAASVVSVGGVSAANIAAGVNLANAATNANTVSSTVKRDASGNFSAGTITATLNGTATNVTGVVDVANGGTGVSSLTLNQLLFGNGTADVGSVAVTGLPGVLLSTNITGAPVWTTSTTGNYLKATTGVGVSFGTIAANDLPANISVTKLADGSVNDTKFQYLSGVTSDIQAQLNAKQSSGSFLTALTGDVTATGPGSVAATVAQVGGVSAANVASGATLANDATNANTSSAIVKRDGSGNFTAGTITATLSGLATNVSGTVAVGNGGTGRTTLTANELLLGNGTTGINTVSVTGTPGVLLSSITTGLPVWSTSTTGNFLKATTGAGVSFGAIGASDLPSGTLIGSGTANYIPYYSAATTLANSPLAVSGNNIGIGTTTPGTILSLSGVGSQIIGMEKPPAGNTAGGGLTLRAGAAASTSVDKAGGYLHLSGGASTGLGTSVIDFATSAAGVTGAASNTPTVKMTIDGAGNVGIGVASPGQKLDVAGTINSTAVTADTIAAATSVTSAAVTGTTVSAGALFAAAATVNGASAGALNMTIRNSSANGYSGTLYVNSASQNQGAMGFANASAALFADTLFMTTLVSKPLTFGVNSTEIIRVDTTGFVGIGNSAPTQKLHVTGNILASGTVTANSDRRLKKNITPIEDALAKLDRITGVRYFWIEPELHNDGEQIGVIAQDVEKVFPQAVITGSDGIKSVSYMGLVAPVIQAIKELNNKFKVVLAKITGLDSRVDTLEKENAELKARLLKIEKSLAKK